MIRKKISNYFLLSSNIQLICKLFQFLKMCFLTGFGKPHPVSVQKLLSLCLSAVFHSKIAPHIGGLHTSQQDVYVFVFSLGHDIEFLMRQGQLFFTLPCILGFSDCFLWSLLTCFSCPCIFFKLGEKSQGLILLSVNIFSVRILHW